MLQAKAAWVKVGGLSCDAGATFGGAVQVIGQTTVTGQAPAPSSSSQLVVQGVTGAMEMRIGYNTTENYGSIQAVESGVGYKNLILNYAGGNVGVGGITAPTQTLGVSGDLNVSAGATFGGQVALQAGAISNGLTASGPDGNMKSIVISNGAKIEIGDVDSGGNEVLLTVDDTTQQITLNADDGITLASWGGVINLAAEKVWINENAGGNALGISSDVGAVFGGDVSLVGSTGSTGSLISFPDGTTQQTAYKEDVIGIYVDNGTEAIEVGTKGHREIPYKCEILSATMTTTVVSKPAFRLFCATPAVWQSTGAGGTLAASIAAPNPAAYYATESSSGWTQNTFNEGDILQFYYMGSSSTDVNLSLKIRKVP